MEPFKNKLNEEAAKRIACAIKRGYPTFPEEKFLHNIAKELAPLELKERNIFLKNRLVKFLPEDKKKCFPILVDALKKNEKDEVGLSGFLVWPLTEFIAEHGLEHFELSMYALYQMTKVFTAEFAVRNFFLRQEDKTLILFKLWAKDECEHVRRLVSEGSRPLLPWGKKLSKFAQNPEKTWPLLEALKNDSSLYVRKSVANHINDHSKNHADLVVKKLKAWKKAYPENKNINWIIRHGTRTLIKKGDQKALELHGIKKVKIKIKYQKILTKQVKMGNALQVELAIANPSNKNITLLIDHEIELLGARGKYRSKVFKGKKVIFRAKEIKIISSQIKIKAVTVRKYYLGTQYWCPIINGEKKKKLAFLLKK